MLLLWCFRTARIVLKTLVNGELFLNQETSTPVAPIPPWILTTGQFKQSVILNSTCASAWMESSGKASKPIFDGMCPLVFFLKKRLLWEVWIPVMQSCVTSWQPRMVEQMVDCLEIWAPLLPSWILDHLLEQLILPRLQKEARHTRSTLKPWLFQFQHFNLSIWINLCLYLPFPICQVDNWNPLTDTVPIHSWIHPWLPLFQSRLEPLYPPIRSKLSHALQRWHPSDASARCILLPWKDVFTAGAWEAFMVKNIIPKLGLFVFLSVTVFSPQRSRTMDSLQSLPSLSSCLFS